MHIFHLLEDPTKEPPGYLDCERGLISVTVIYHEYTRPRKETRVHKFDMHRKSPNLENVYGNRAHSLSVQ